MAKCQAEGCRQVVSQKGHALCLEHWKAAREGTLIHCERCRTWHPNDGRVCHAGSRALEKEVPADDGARDGFLSSTAIGREFGLSNVRINLTLAELGWIEKYVKGWVPTDRGNALGANVREMRNGTPFVVWPASIMANAALRASVIEQSGGNNRSIVCSAPNPAPDTPKDNSADFRSRFPAVFRTQDGHMVRSKAEVLIDNWLYMQGIVHAYERRLPIEEECYCDFYLPKGQGIYIEFWGMESNAKYRERKAVKQAIYVKHGLRLIEMGDAEIEKLDDVLPKMLLRFGVESA